MLVKSMGKFYTFFFELHLPYKCSVYETESVEEAALVEKSFWSVNAAIKYGLARILEWSNLDMKPHYFVVKDLDGNMKYCESTEKLVNVRYVLSSSSNR